MKTYEIQKLIELEEDVKMYRRESVTNELEDWFIFIENLRYEELQKRSNHYRLIEIRGDLTIEISSFYFYRT